MFTPVGLTPIVRQFGVHVNFGETNNLLLVRVDSGEILEFPDRKRSIWSVAWSPDGTQLAVSGGEYPIEILDALINNASSGAF